MNLDVNAIKSSFEIAKPIANEIVDHFYDFMFENYPESKPLFQKANMPMQKQALIRSLVHIVDHLDEIDVLVKYLKTLGFRHQNYGVKDEHYTIVGKCLIATFKHFFAEKWTHELEDQWINAIGLIAETMIAGAHERPKQSDPVLSRPLPFKNAEQKDDLSIHQMAKQFARQILSQSLNEVFEAEFKQLAKQKAKEFLIQALKDEAEEVQLDFNRKKVG